MGKIAAFGANSFLAKNWIRNSLFKNKILQLHHDQIDEFDFNDSIAVVINFMRDRNLDCMEMSSKNNDVKLIEALKRSSDAKYIFLSTRLVYGRSEYTSCSESGLLKPDGLYAQNKILCENMVSKCLGNRALILRLSNVFGCEFDDDRSTFMSWFARKISSNDEIIIEANRFDFRDFLPVGVFSAILDELIFSEVSGIINVGSGVGIYLEDFVDAVLDGGRLARSINFNCERRDGFVMNVSKLWSRTSIRADRVEILDYARLVGASIS